MQETDPVKIITDDTVTKETCVDSVESIKIENPDIFQTVEKADNAINYHEQRLKLEREKFEETKARNTREAKHYDRLEQELDDDKKRKKVLFWVYIGCFLLFGGLSWWVGLFDFSDKASSITAIALLITMLINVFENC